jgi:hypothetical protein
VLSSQKLDFATVKGLIVSAIGSFECSKLRLAGGIFWVSGASSLQIAPVKAADIVAVVIYHLTTLIAEAPLLDADEII